MCPHLLGKYGVFHRCALLEIGELHGFQEQFCRGSVLQQERTCAEFDLLWPLGALENISSSYGVTSLPFFEHVPNILLCRFSANNCMGYTSEDF